MARIHFLFFAALICSNIIWCRYPLKMHLPSPYKTKPLMFIRLWILPIYATNGTYCGLAFMLFSSMLHTCSSYGNTGCRVFNPGVQNWKDFGLKINIPKGNYWILRIWLMGRCQKVPKFDFQSQFSIDTSMYYYTACNCTVK